MSAGSAEQAPSSSEADMGIESLFGIIMQGYVITADEMDWLLQYVATRRGRRTFADHLNMYRNSSNLSTESFECVVEIMRASLESCFQAMDINSGKRLMNMAMTFRGTAENGDVLDLQSSLRGCQLWQVDGFWEEAFFDSIVLEQQRLGLPVDRDWRQATEEERDEYDTWVRNTTFGQLGSFSFNMIHFGVSLKFTQAFVSKLCDSTEIGESERAMILELNEHEAASVAALQAERKKKEWLAEQKAGWSSGQRRRRRGLAREDTSLEQAVLLHKDMAMSTSQNMGGGGVGEGDSGHSTTNTVLALKESTWRRGMEHYLSSIDLHPSSTSASTRTEMVTLPPETSGHENVSSDYDRLAFLTALQEVCQKNRSDGFDAVVACLSAFPLTQNENVRLHDLPAEDIERWTTIVEGGLQQWPLSEWGALILLTCYFVDDVSHLLLHRQAAIFAEGLLMEYFSGICACYQQLAEGQPHYWAEVMTVSLCWYVFTTHPVVSDESPSVAEACRDWLGLNGLLPQIVHTIEFIGAMDGIALGVPLSVKWIYSLNKCQSLLMELLAAFDSQTVFLKREHRQTLRIRRLSSAISSKFVETETLYEKLERAILSKL